MRARALTALALLVSLVALVLVLSRPNLARRTVFVAKENLAAGTRLTPQLIEAVPIRTPSELFSPGPEKRLVGQRLAIAVTRGTPLSPSLFAGTASGARLFAVKIALSSAAGPGALVDILQLGSSSPPKLIATAVTVVRKAAAATSTQPEAVVAVPLPLAEALMATPKGQALIGIVEEGPK